MYECNYYFDLYSYCDRILKTFAPHDSPPPENDGIGGISAVFRYVLVQYYIVLYYIVLYYIQPIQPIQPEQPIQPIQPEQPIPLRSTYPLLLYQVE